VVSFCQDCLRVLLVIVWCRDIFLFARFLEPKDANQGDNIEVNFDSKPHSAEGCEITSFGLIFFCRAGLST
jgi:hypothetical protein